jgi:hypothetical protein
MNNILEKKLTVVVRIVVSMLIYEISKYIEFLILIRF